MCPRCHKNAPIVYRGMAAYCTACGAPRLPLAASSVTLAGKGSRIGGTVARGFGWVILVGGLSVALIIGAFLQWVIEGGVAGFAIGGPIAFASLVFGYLLLKGGKSLHRQGAGEEKGARTRALFALAQHRNGMITAMDAAQALDISPADADALLTDLAKTTPEQVSLELDDAGGIFFRFLQFTGGLGTWQGPAVRVDASVAPTRVAPTGVPQDVEVLEAEVIPPARQQR